MNICSINAFDINKLDNSKLIDKKISKSEYDSLGRNNYIIYGNKIIWNYSINIFYIQIYL